jgi:oligopeptide transport system ATP-binding protein
MAMIFQDALSALNPVLSVGYQLGEMFRVHQGLSKKAAKAKAVELMDRVRIPAAKQRVDDYPHQFSGGMRQRIMIAMALACEPQLFVADEATTALDVTVQRDILDLLGEIQRERHMTMIVVSHDLGVVAGRTDEVAVMYGGRIVEQAPTRALFADYRHRYTEALLAAIPHLGHDAHKRLATIPGRPPNLLSRDGGCPFAPRCGHAAPICAETFPAVAVSGTPAHTYHCHVPVERSGVAA